MRTLVRVGVVPRPGATAVVPDGWGATRFPWTPLILSSSYVRGLEPTSMNLRHYLPESVIPLFQSAEANVRGMAVRLFDATDPQPTRLGVWKRRRGVEEKIVA